MNRCFVLRDSETGHINASYCCTVASALCDHQDAIPIVRTDDVRYKGEAVCFDHIGLVTIVGIRSKAELWRGRG